MHMALTLVQYPINYVFCSFVAHPLVTIVLII